MFLGVVFQSLHVSGCASWGMTYSVSISGQAPDGSTISDEQRKALRAAVAECVKDIRAAGLLVTYASETGYDVLKDMSDAKAPESDDSEE